MNARSMATAAIVSMTVVVQAETGGVANSTTSANDPAVVQVQGASMCSGTFVASHVILTAAHCVVDDRGRGALVLVGPRQSTNVVLAPTWTTTHSQADDWALVVLSGFPSPAPPHMLSEHDPPIGPDVTVVGYPYDSYGAQVEAQGYVYAKDGDVLRYTATTRQGMSGGPVLNRQGTIVGVNAYIEWPSYIFDTPTSAGPAVNDVMRQAARGLGAPTHRLRLPLVGRTTT